MFFAHDFSEQTPEPGSMFGSVGFATPTFIAASKIIARHSGQI
jgi:hypothetical protein